MVCSLRCRIGERCTIDTYREKMIVQTPLNSMCRTNTTRNLPPAATANTNKDSRINKQNRQSLLRKVSLLPTTILLPIVLLLLSQSQPPPKSTTTSTNMFFLVQAASYSVTLNAKDTDCYEFRVPKKPVTIRYDMFDAILFRVVLNLGCTHKLRLLFYFQNRKW